MPGRLPPIVSSVYMGNVFYSAERNDREQNGCESGSDDHHVTMMIITIMVMAIINDCKHASSSFSQTVNNLLNK